MHISCGTIHLTWSITVATYSEHLNCLKNYLDQARFGIWSRGESKRGVEKI